jgi:aminoglycoside phosphotransferase (APT) family kinase protein/predicted metal-dependent phosphoesterase TrpH
MILDMHCHTLEHSHCSHVAAADLVQSNFDKGLQGTVLTDHHYLWQPAELAELRSRVHVPDHYLILAGQEVETPELGHVLVYGADVSLAPETSLTVIRSRFPAAALVWAHPYRSENIPSPEKLLYLLIDGIEIFTSNHTVAENTRALRDWHRYKFTAISGSDTHGLSYTGLYPTAFDHPVSSILELAAEIRAGRCRPFFMEIPRSGTSSTRVTEITLGAAGSGTPEKYVIRSHRNVSKWRSAARTSRIIEEIRSQGFDTGRYRVPKQFSHDEKDLTVIEQGIQGKTLFDKLVLGSREEAHYCLKLAAEWLARLHNARLRITPPDQYLHDEPDHLAFYVSAFTDAGHRHARNAREIMQMVLEMEFALYRDRPERLVQGHGDYHPKNIFIGRDNDEDPSSSYVAAIDFGSSYTMPPAYDVGTFLAQFRNQFYGNRAVLSKVPEELFLSTYLQQIGRPDSDFLLQVELYKARTALSICYHLIKVGLGDSENLWRVLIEAGRILTHLQVKSMGNYATIERTGEGQKSA